jgi:2-polyprenyl-3-methyl-5-hydroxy-6-metoxy-1,4-benzoquinol methylase
MEFTTCNLCGERQNARLFTAPDLLLNRKNVQATFVRCASCGMIYQNPRPTIEEMQQHYPPEYESYLEIHNNHISWLMDQAINYGTVKRGRFIVKYKHSGRLLDVGCATGFFLNGMRSQGDWELHGVEINPYAAEIARDRYGLKVCTGTLIEAAYPAHFFDVITMWDVLEHLHQPLENLREIERILKPDGLLVLRVPNVSSLDAKLFKRYWAGYDAPRHLYVFSPRTLEELLREAGFNPINCSSHSGNYTTFLLSLRFWINAHGCNSKSVNSLLRILYHPIMRICSAPIFYLRGLGLRGSQIVVTAAKANGN